MNISSILFKNLYIPLNRKSLEKIYKLSIGRFYQNPFNLAMIEKKILFIHIPKTGGTSIANGLFGDFSGHAYLYEFYIANKIYTKDFYKICVVRNPFDRLVSAYSHLSQKNIRSENRDLLNYFNIKSFDDLIFCLNDPKKWRVFQNTILMLRPQCEFIYHQQIKMDKIYRFENFNDIQSHLKTELDIDINLNHLNSTKRKNYKEYYNDFSISVVEKIYKKDLEMFNYTFD